MTQVEARARPLIAAAKQAYGATASDRARVRLALAARLAATEPPNVPARQGGGTARRAATASLGVRVVGLVLLLGAGEAYLRAGGRAPVGEAATVPQVASVGLTAPGSDTSDETLAATPEPAVGEPSASPPSQALSHPTASAPRPGGLGVSPKDTRLGGAPKEPADDPSTLADELAALREATVALRDNDPQLSLARLDALAARHPQGLLRGERMVGQVLSLCALGRTQQARALADRFLREALGSPLAPRVRESCAFEHPPRATTDSAAAGHSSTSKE